MTTESPRNLDWTDLTRAREGALLEVTLTWATYDDDGVHRHERTTIATFIGDGPCNMTWRIEIPDDNIRPKFWRPGQTREVTLWGKERLHAEPFAFPTWARNERSCRVRWATPESLRAAISRRETEAALEHVVDAFKAHSAAVAAALREVATAA